MRRIQIKAGKQYEPSHGVRGGDHPDCSYCCEHRRFNSNFDVHNNEYNHYIAW